ncbi:hypothetical protein F5X96DRAFT_650163 [Biscogniauxia mediterranea]|nr:hypothetical protein F5X96DRAFT_650163 [Biscogniauxia mediterranea]
MMQNWILLLGFLATSVLSAVIFTDEPGFDRQEVRTEASELPLVSRVHNVGRQLQLPVEGKWIWGSNQDQCDDSNEYSAVYGDAIITSTACQLLQTYMSNHPGYYHASDWKTNEQYAVAIYGDCTVSLVLNDQDKDVVSIGSQNIADLLSHVFDPNNHLIVPDDTISVTGKGTCSAEPSSANVSWIVHQTNGLPWDSSMVEIAPAESGSGEHKN